MGLGSVGLVFRGTLFRGNNRDPTISGTILGSPIFGNSYIEVSGQGLSLRA